MANQTNPETEITKLIKYFQITKYLTLSFWKLAVSWKCRGWFVRVGVAGLHEEVGKEAVGRVVALDPLIELYCCA